MKKIKQTIYYVNGEQKSANGHLKIETLIKRNAEKATYYTTHTHDGYCEHEDVNLLTGETFNKNNFIHELPNGKYY